MFNTLKRYLITLLLLVCLPGIAQITQWKGTGFFITRDGYLVTSSEVSRTATRFTVTVDGEELPATLVGEGQDFAVLHVECEHGQAVRLSEFDSASDKIIVGGCSAPTNGNPSGLAFKNGKVADRRFLGNRWVVGLDFDRIPDWSGAPVFGKDGGVIGLIFNGQLPAEELKELVLKEQELQAGLEPDPKKMKEVEQKRKALEEQQQQAMFISTSVLTGLLEAHRIDVERVTEEKPVDEVALINREASNIVKVTAYGSSTAREREAAAILPPFPLRTASPELARCFLGHRGGIWSIAFSPNGERLASIGYALGFNQFQAKDANNRDIIVNSYQYNGEAIIWDTGSGRLERVLVDYGSLPGESDIRFAILFMPDSNRVITGGASVCMWDATTGKILASSPGVHAELMALCPETSMLYTAGTFNTSLLYLYKTKDPGFHLLDTLKETGVHTLALSPDGKYFATTVATGSAACPVQIHDTRYGDTLWEFVGHAQSVTALAFSPDSRLLASACEDGTVMIWRMNPRKPLLRITDNQGVARALAFSSDGRFLITGSDDVYIRDVNTGALVNTLHLGIETEITSLAVSLDGKWIASSHCGDNLPGIIALWDIGKLHCGPYTPKIEFTQPK